MTTVTAVTVCDRLRVVTEAFPLSGEFIRAAAEKNRRNAEQSVSGLYALLMLVQRAGLDSNALEIVREKGGRPIFKGEGMPHFSIAHSYGLAVCALSDCPVGADTELLRVKPNAVSLAERYFSRGEAEQVGRAKDSSTEFFRVWTRKEALIKRAGKGVDGRPDSFDTTAESFSEYRASAFGGEYIISVTGESEFVVTDESVLAR